MECPNCNSKLKTKLITDYEFDLFEQCVGMWFDNDELRALVDKTDTDLNWLAFNIWEKRDQYIFFNKRKRCSRCQVELVSIEYRDTGVDIDYCINCNGVWLDNGDFKKKIEVLEKELWNKTIHEYIMERIKEVRNLLPMMKDLSQIGKICLMLSEC